VTLMLLVVYGSGFIAFISSWFRNRIYEIVTYVFSTISILSGALVGFSLREGNGLFIAIIPITLGIFAVWNVKRRKQFSADS